MLFLNQANVREEKNKWLDIGGQTAMVIFDQQPSRRL